MIRTWIGGAAATVLAGTFCTTLNAAVVYSNDFNGNTYTGGAASPALLAGQNSWATALTTSAALSNQTTGLNTTRAVRNNASATGTNNTTGAQLNVSSLGLTGSGQIYVEFDFMRDGVGGDHAAMVGIGAQGSTPMHFGMQNSVLMIRGKDFSSTTYLYTSANVMAQTVVGNWYRMRAVFDQTTNSLSISVRDLTGNDSAISDSGFQALYVDTAATQTTLTSAYSGDETTWNTLWLRTTNSPAPASGTGSGWIDNIEISADQTIPEPATLGVTLLLLPLLARRR